MLQWWAGPGENSQGLPNFAASPALGGHHACVSEGIEMDLDFSLSTFAWRYVLRHPVSGHSAPGGPGGQVVETVYHRFPTDGASKSMGASQSLNCEAPEEQGSPGWCMRRRPVVTGEGSGVSTLKNKTEILQRCFWFCLDRRLFGTGRFTLAEPGCHSA